MATHDAASIIYQTLGRGVTRSKRRAMQWRRKAAENGHAGACLTLAGRMYADLPYAREVGHVGEAAGVAASVGVVEGHDVPPDVLTSVVLGCGRGDISQSTRLTSYADKRWRGVSIATTTGAKLRAFRRTSRFARNARPPGTAATHVRHRIGRRVGTK